VSLHECLQVGTAHCWLRPSRSRWISQRAARRAASRCSGWTSWRTCSSPAPCATWRARRQPRRSPTSCTHCCAWTPSSTGCATGLLRAWPRSARCSTRACTRKWAPRSCTSSSRGCVRSTLVVLPKPLPPRLPYRTKLCVFLRRRESQRDLKHTFKRLQGSPYGVGQGELLRGGVLSLSPVMLLQPKGRRHRGYTTPSS
jgi:hypothetical protein